MGQVFVDHDPIQGGVGDRIRRAGGAALEAAGRPGARVIFPVVRVRVIPY